MKKRLLLIVNTISLITITFACYGGEKIPTGPTLNSEDRNTIFTVINEAIDKNAAYKDIINIGNKNKTKQARSQLSSYYQNNVVPLFSKIVGHLVIDDDIELCVKYLELISSFQNYADEKLPFTIGKVYIKNPKVVINSLDQFNGKEKDEIASLIKFGVMNVAHTLKYSPDKTKALLEPLK